MISESAYSLPAVEAISSEIVKLLKLGRISTLGVCGLGGTGKSSVCREVAKRNPQTIVFEIDWFCEHSSADRRLLVKKALAENDQSALAHWEDPSAWYDWNLLLKNLKELRKTGKLHLKNAWRQSTGEKDLQIDLQLPKGHCVILVDGIYLLHPLIRKELDRVILLTISNQLSIERSALRDQHRSDAEYLHWKAKLLESFDSPYFERYGGNVDLEVKI